MDDVRVGRICRALRRRRGWRQLDLSARARCSQRAISDIERGHAGGYRLDFVRAVFAALDASFDGIVGWRAGDLDRLLDDGHSTLVEAAARRLRALGWEVIPEVTYSEFGERGSIDLLGFHAGRRAIAVLEVKTELASIEATLRKHHEKIRLARDRVAERRIGWRPRAIGGLLVIGENRSARRLIDSRHVTFDAAYPLRGRDVTRWLGAPNGDAYGVWFLTPSNGSAGSQTQGGSRRVRASRSRFSERLLEDHQARGRLDA